MTRYAADPEWADVTPIAQQEPAGAAVQIAYTAECMIEKLI